jgi:hypothetical protein
MAKGALDIPLLCRIQRPLLRVETNAIDGLNRYCYVAKVVKLPDLV